MTNSEKNSILLANGWLEYYGNTWIKKSWLEDGRPYERMALSLDEAFKKVEPHPFDKYHQKALEESKNERTRD